MGDGLKCRDWGWFDVPSVPSPMERDRPASGGCGELRTKNIDYGAGRQRKRHFACHLAADL